MIMGIRTLIWKKCTFEKYNFIPHPAGLTSNISEHSFTAQQYVDCVFNMIMGIRTLMWKSAPLKNITLLPTWTLLKYFRAFFHCSTNHIPCVLIMGIRTLIWKSAFEKYNFTPHLVLAVPQMFQSFHCTTSNNGPNMYFWSVLCVTI